MAIGDEFGGKPQYPPSSGVDTQKTFDDLSANLLGMRNSATQSNEDSFSLPRKTRGIQKDRWDKRYEYSFRVSYADPVTGITDGAFITAPNGMSVSEVPLLIPPQSLSISAQFASQVTATNDGIYEENNGVVFRTISISGTTAIYSPRGGIDAPKSTGLASIASSIFPAAVAGVNNLVSNFKKVLGGNFKPLDTNVELTKTGYYQFWRLNNFLIEYAEAKKKKENNVDFPLRLIFSCPKDNISYVVTPVSFTGGRDASNPMLYRYSIILRAWDIVDDDQSQIEPVNNDIPDANNAFSIKRLLAKIKQARQTIQSSSGVIQGVQSDVFDIMNVVGQVVLGLKDGVGVAATVLDFLPTLVNNAELLIKNNARQMNQALLNLKKTSSDYNSLPSNLSAADLLGTRGTNSNLSVISSRIEANGGAVSSSASVSGPVTGTGQRVSPTGERSDVSSSSDINASKSLNALFNNVKAVDAIQMSELGVLPKTVQDQINKQTIAAARTDAGVVKGLISKLQEMSNNVATAAGLMDDTYAITYGVPKQGANARAPNEEDILLVAAIEETRDALISALATGTLFKEKQDDPFKSANSFLEKSDQLPTPTSAFVMTIDRGETLERLALSTLGNAKRAREIAILNNLRAPYIDEDGFALPVSLAAGRTFVVQDVSKLELRQFIVIRGNLLPSTRRQILNIESIGGGNFRITVDGKLNLDTYISSSNPQLQARLPGTVGSGDSVLIPSAESPDEKSQNRDTSLSQRLNYAERLFKVDIALDQNNDWQIGPNGDVAVSYGYQNAIQALRGIVETERGELELHPFFGLDAAVGQRIDTDLANTVKTRITAAILSDKRFNSATVTVTLQGTVLLVSIVAIGRKGTGRIALQFKIAA